MPAIRELPNITGDYWISLGHVYSQCAQTEKAIQAQENALQYHRNNGSEIGIGEALAHLARVECWTKPEAAKAHAQEAIDLACQTGNLVDKQNARLAFIIAAAGITPEEEIQTTLQETEFFARQTDNRRSFLSFLRARAWHAAVRNNTETLGRHIDEIDRLASSIDSGEHWTDIARAWLPGHTREHTELAKRWQWLDSAEKTMRRWRKLLDDRRALAG